MHAVWVAELCGGLGGGCLGEIFLEERSQGLGNSGEVIVCFGQVRCAPSWGNPALWFFVRDILYAVFLSIVYINVSVCVFGAYMLDKIPLRFSQICVQMIFQPNEMQSRKVERAASTRSSSCLIPSPKVYYMNERHLARFPLISHSVL